MWVWVSPSRWLYNTSRSIDIENLRCISNPLIHFAANWNDLHRQNCKWDRYEGRMGWMIRLLVPSCIIAAVNLQQRTACLQPASRCAGVDSIFLPRPELQPDPDSADIWYGCKETPLWHGRLVTPPSPAHSVPDDPWAHLCRDEEGLRWMENCTGWSLLLPGLHRAAGVVAACLRLVQAATPHLPKPTPPSVLGRIRPDHPSI